MQNSFIHHHASQRIVTPTFLYLLLLLYFSAAQHFCIFSPYHHHPSETLITMPKSPRAPVGSSQNLSPAQKQHLLTHYHAQKAAYPAYTLSDLAHWATTTFQLTYTPSRRTISRILNQPEPSGSQHKPPTAAAELDRELADWVEDKQSRNIMINGQLIRQQGQIIQQRINKGLPEDQQLSLKFSNGWQDKFYQRHSFRQQAAHGESGSVQQEIINRELPAIREVLQHFQPQDIFNADESALFYNMPPNKTIGSAPTPGLKKNKTRITILLACNSTGSERLEPLFIGKHKQPRAFNKQTPEDLGIQYFFNNTAWMTRSIFTIWLSSLDRYVGQTPGRKILLLLDNFSGHGTPQEPLTELQNITIQFLPANTTSRMQPLDGHSHGHEALPTDLEGVQWQHSQELLEAYWTGGC